ncbi:MAG TPA: hypothetical protein VGR87_10800 [Candidatus Limnocylindria bacterium]|jgi:hypothetical protein|nr:hypothetical protein [Candidatus Limnocylindria bacterium]
MKPVVLSLPGMALLACGELANGQALSGSTEIALANQRWNDELPNVVGYGRVDSMSGAFVETAGELARWIETRHGPTGPIVTTSRWHNLPGLEPPVVCYYDGAFSSFPRPKRDVEPPPYDRIRIIIQPGATGHVLDVAGYRATLPIVRPAP